jgi:lipopolysaccharide transport system ATP-binding protein
MNDIAIRVENLGKMYRIGGEQESYQTFRDAITRTVSAPFRRASDLLRGQSYGAAGLKEEIWALKDISFEVKRGEVVGIIGRNGAGKSTLLKVLSRITEPTSGYADIYGRVGALLEVGTGFHPELTGRENVYLNGAILGMSRRDIDRKFDEIVDFAGVEKFIDTPVKHYSSGMGLRLGFAVAAYLEPDILVVDEVLAVGDAEFQKKCLGRMTDIAGEGRTVLFVSHNMAAISSLCQSAFLLNQGQIIYKGTSSEAISYYIQNSQNIVQQDLSDRIDRTGTQSTRVEVIHFRSSQGIITDTVLSGEDVEIELHYASTHKNLLNKVKVNLVFVSEIGVRLFCCHSDVINSSIGNLDSSGKLICNIPKLPLIPGRYSLDFALVIDGQSTDVVNDAGSFNVIEGSFYSTGKLPPVRKGIFLVEYDWSTK